MGRSATPHALTAVACAMVLAAAGCTICPDPFDYSGPVPDGSAPQNDFRARANGIAPLGPVPRPWPPVVQAPPAEDGEPDAVIAAAEEPMGDEAGADAEPSPASEDTDSPVRAAAAETPANTAAAGGAEIPVVEEPVVEEPTVEDVLPFAAPQRLEIAPPLRETPGWRPRG